MVIDIHSARESALCLDFNGLDEADGRFFGSLENR